MLLREVLAVVVFLLSLLLRLATEGWLVAVVVRDLLRPVSDRVRRSGLDDPTGGVLDGAPDVLWHQRLRTAVLGQYR